MSTFCTIHTHEKPLNPTVSFVNSVGYQMKKILRHLRDVFIVCLFVIFSTSFAYAVEDLVSVVTSGDKEMLESLIANGVDVKTDKGGFALSMAAMVGKYENVEVLIAHGANVNAREPINGFTPLHQAVSYIGYRPMNPSGEMPPMDVGVAKSKKKIVELLIEHGADVNNRNKYGVTPLYSAATKEMAELLIKHGANVNAMNINNNTPLYDAISHNKEVVEVLIAHGADVNNKDRSGNTPLHVAINVRNKEIAELLIQHGADVNTKNQNGLSLVEFAVQSDRLDFVPLLMAHGAKVNSDGYRGRTGLNIAVGSGSPQMVEVMLKNGAQVNDTDRGGQTALGFAVGNNQKDIAELLIKHGADVNIVTRNGIPLLHSTRDKAMLKLLLIHGADANIKDLHGDTLLWYVCYDKQLTEILLKHGADINIKNSQGRTALHLATRFARDNVAKWLLAHGADVNAKDDYYGQTPLFHAIRSYERYFVSASAPVRAPHPVAASDSRQAELASSLTPITSADDLNNAFPSGLDVSNSKATVKLLLAHRADVKATDRQGQSTLHVAPTKDIAELLLAHGASVNAKRTDEATALHLASVYGRKEVVKVLLAHGADVSARTKDGITPLHYAKGAEVVKLLLASGANVNALDSGGNSPLYMADEQAVIELLLEHGATLNTRNNIGQTPLLRVIRTYISNLPGHGLMSGPLGDDIVVAHGGNIDVINALLEHGADVNLDDRDLNMPLFYVREAIKDRSYEKVVDLLKTVEKSLLAHGAKLEKRRREKV